MFIGEKEVSNVLENKVTFVDGTEKEYSQKILDYVLTKEPKDLTAMRDLVGLHVADEILEVLKAHDVQKGYINHIFNLVVHSHEMMFATAIGKAFGTYEEGRHPSSFEENVKMSDISKFIN